MKYQDIADKYGFSLSAVKSWAFCYRKTGKGNRKCHKKAMANGMSITEAVKEATKETEAWMTSHVMESMLLSVSAGSGAFRRTSAGTNERLGCIGNEIVEENTRHNKRNAECYYFYPMQSTKRREKSDRNGKSPL